ncbi:exonuclease domain-containing protein [Salipiger sp. P9]|uniref:3'-5' exonuclease n=1 Tax=Salipiger pentaromativorans TaxID=2943193 RepID=UPI0021586468|nr:exonuclease domain-containing protein [Salipiger pentaromativorans]MCR8549637.1 exonuclease domain-containing protein [Salipiger pentaromativorans]
MISKLGLRLRIFLFFVLLGLGGALAVLIALYVGYTRVAGSSVANGFVFAGILASLALVALTAGIWLLFDENVAKPIEKIAAEMRARAHAGVAKEVDTHAARYLGDLAHAARAVSDRLTEGAMETAQTVAFETERLASEKARLTALLTEIPVAMILVSPRGQIVLYDGQAAEVLAQLHVPRLNAPLTDFFEAEGLEAAVRRMHKTGREVQFTAEGTDGAQSYDARLKPMDGGGYMMVIEGAETHMPPEAERPLVYDFDLLTHDAPASIEEAPLSALSYTVFDTETTGLLPHKDEVVQIGAVRVLNGRIVPGEVIDQLVDPGMPIPPASTRVHKVTDAMVRGQPDIAEAGRRFHRFAKGSVIVAHNAPFDMAFLRRHRDRMGVQWDHPILDTVLLSAVLFGASQTHTLDALCERLGVEIPAPLRHTALGDAHATAQVLVKMLPMLEARGMARFGEVLDETRKHGRLLEDLN